MSARPSITVTSLVNTAPTQVAAMLAPLEGVADEIVLAIDDRVDPAWVDDYLALADRVIVVPFFGAFSHMYAWLRTRCGGDWIFQMDADEMPGAGLDEVLLTAVRVPDITHAWIRRRWLWPDAGRFLAQWPWRPDYSLRLFRNDPSLVRFPGGFHLPVAVLGPRRYLTGYVYHGHLLLKTRSEREATCASYEERWPGLLMEGRPFNEAYYLPELRECELRTAAVPVADAAAAATLVGGPRTSLAARPSRHRNGILETAARDELEASWERRALGADAYRAELRLLDDDLRIVAGDWRTFDVEVVNRSGETWPGGMDKHPQIRLAYRWLSSRGRLVEREGRRTAFGASVSPGERCVVPMEVAAPARKGEYVLELDLVHEEVRWFGTTLAVEVAVRPR